MKQLKLHGNPIDKTQSYKHFCRNLIPGLLLIDGAKVGVVPHGYYSKTYSSTVDTLNSGNSNPSKEIDLGDVLSQLIIADLTESEKQEILHEIFPVQHQNRNEINTKNKVTTMDYISMVDKIGAILLQTKGMPLSVLFDSLEKSLNCNLTKEDQILVKKIYQLINQALQKEQQEKLRKIKKVVAIMIEKKKKVMQELNNRDKKLISYHTNVETYDNSSFNEGSYINVTQSN